MKYGDQFKAEMKDDESIKKTKGSIAGGGKETYDKKAVKASKDVKQKKEVMAGKMDKYGVNMECMNCGKKGHKAKDCSY